MNRFASMPGIHARVRIVIVASVLYFLALTGLGIYFGRGGVNDTKLGVVAIALPAACVLALVLMIQWRKLDGER